MNDWTAPERETTVTTSDADALVHIWTAQRRYITKLRRDKAFTEVESGFHGKGEWASFTIPAGEWSPVGVKRRRNLTSNARNEAAARLRAAREGA